MRATRGAHRTSTRKQRAAGSRPTSTSVRAPRPEVIGEPPAERSGSIIEQHPRASPIQITHETSITGDAAEALWHSYRANFEPLASLAVLQHFYSREEILGELANPRILKIVGWQSGAPVGLAMVTNSLEDVPQISPDFLRSNYPEHAATNSICFGILVMVDPTCEGARCSAGCTSQLRAFQTGSGIYDCLLAAVLVTDLVSAPEIIAEIGGALHAHPHHWIGFFALRRHAGDACASIWATKQTKHRNDAGPNVL